MVFRLDLGKISFNLVGNAFATRQLALLATSFASYDILARACAEIKILRSFPPTEVEYRGCQFWLKVMTLEVEERPRLVTAGYGRHRSQWVNYLTFPKVALSLM